jgi:H+/Cl- antiporter ClcA
MNSAQDSNRIPISISLDQITDQPVATAGITESKSRLVFICLLAVIIGACISAIAKFLVLLINLITNISFHQQFSMAHSTPMHHGLGVWVIIVPALGGLVVGIMALYGSKAIRGHGIPEAMEQILTNSSKIKPSITFLKPISSAISIGTGGPFGSEGPIIATGGALGSTLGQLLSISSNERKILLASGATAGMSAIFGSPIAGIFLAIELLLFEFSPRSIMPVALACITGAAGHHLFFEPGPVFAAPFIESPANISIAAYSVIGIIIGLLSAVVTKIVYVIEDGFEKLPIHWMWWPAIGGLAVGVVGYFAPATLGVGYENISNLLSGTLTLHVIVYLCLFKFISWAVALGSGTSGGTLAPLLTIGGATGALLGALCIYLFPASGVTMTLAALVGMSAMFAGASRALLTSIIFAIETTGQVNALIPLLSGCVASYFVSYVTMKNTIMTEKIARRGVFTPHHYESDILDKITVGKVLKRTRTVISSSNTIGEVRAWLADRKEQQHNYYIVANDHGEFKGIISSSNLFSMHHSEKKLVGDLIKRKPFAVSDVDTLKVAVQMMAQENLDELPVISAADNKLAGALSYRDILPVYNRHVIDNQESRTISLKRRTLKLVVHGKNTLSILRPINKNEGKS